MARRRKPSSSNWQLTLLELIAEKATPFASRIESGGMARLKDFTASFCDFVKIMASENSEADSGALWRQYEELANSSKELENSILRFQRHLASPHEPSGERLFEELWRLLSVVSTRAQTPISDKSAKSEATKRLKALKSAISTAKISAEISEVLRADYARLSKSPGAQGFPHKRRFVFACLEIWIAASGKKPSHSNARFASFLSSLWGDKIAKGAIDQDWEHSVRAVRESIPEPTIQRLITHGPDWFHG